MDSDRAVLTLSRIDVLCKPLSKISGEQLGDKLEADQSYTIWILPNRGKISEINHDPTILHWYNMMQADSVGVRRREDISTAKQPVSNCSLAKTVTTASTKTKLGQEQERLGYEAALRLQAELKEEERQRIASIQEAASSFNIEEYDDTQARVEADEELAQRLQAEEREKYSEVEKARLLAELVNQRKSEIERAIPELTTRSSKRDAEEELSQESSKRQKTRESLELGSTGRSSELEIILRVHHVSTEKGIDIYMLLEKEYPLSRGTLIQMLVAKLLVEQDNEMSRELLRKIFMQVKRPRK
ncbi:hypothetical protein Tco_1501696 [Tanacetum coccineum]